jgi:hypothetical protein
MGTGIAVRAQPPCGGEIRRETGKHIHGMLEMRECETHRGSKTGIYQNHATATEGTETETKTETGSGVAPTIRAGDTTRSKLSWSARGRRSAGLRGQSGVRRGKVRMHPAMRTATVSAMAIGGQIRHSRALRLRRTSHPRRGGMGARGVRPA